MFGGATADFWEVLRRTVIPPLHAFLKRYGYWAESTTHEYEYTTTLRVDPEQFERTLGKWGFHRNPVAGLKRRKSNGDPELGSWRKLYRDREDGSVEPSSNPTAKWQLHVRYFRSTVEDGALDLYTHWEINWGHNPIKHYNGVGWNAKKGERRMMAFIRDEYADDRFFDKYVEGDK